MTPIDFLKAVWPATGIYCLAIPRPSGGYKHWLFDTIEEAADHAARASSQADIYFNVHTLLERQVPHLTEPGKTQVRVQRNMKQARCFFFDIDIGENDPRKYSDRNEALAALKEFCKVTKLPRPAVASSGGGFHVYWLMDDPLESRQEWRKVALMLRQLAIFYGFKIDRSRTTDTSSVLRVVGTFNRKDKANPRPVELVFTGSETPTQQLVKAINSARINADIQESAPPALAEAEQNLGGNLQVAYEGANPSIAAVLSSCAQMRRIRELRGNFSEPEWYRIAIGVGRFIEGEERSAHKLSKGHPSYSEDACNAKIKQNKISQKGPSSCNTVASTSEVGDTLCLECPYAGKVYGPIQAALYSDPAPAPVHMELVGDVETQLAIPDPPEPFLRMKGGAGVAVNVTNADGSKEPTLIYEYDLYPIRRLANTQQGVEQQVWHVCLPNNEAKDFTLDAETLYDSRKFAAAISNQGIFAARANLQHLQEYMVAYIAQLQKLAAADAQCNHLGWIEDQEAFILPDKVLRTDGSVRAAQLSLGAQRASAAVEKRGSWQKQVELLKFYAHPHYMPNQFMILSSLAAPIFFATGHHGVVVNASGNAGASKSTSLYAGASFWGAPEMYPINGTNNGATVKGRNERVTVLANLPVMVDEITHMPAKDAIDLAMSVTQPGHRIRLQQDGVERASTGSYKATIMCTTANNSLHNTLSHDNAAGTAGSMRVFEIVFTATRVHQKYQADEFLHALKENYGHIGPMFIAEVIKRKAWVIQRVREVQKEIDQECAILASERFWSAVVAAVLVAGELAVSMGLLSFDIPALRRWVVQHQIPFMRGVVQNEYSDPLSILTDYLAEINGNIVIMRKSAGNIPNVLHQPKSGALLGHYDIDDGMLYLLKKAFKDHCGKIGANSTKIIDDLHQARAGGRVIPQKDTRRVLGAGTDQAKGQSWCFGINMTHPDVSGQVNLTVIQGGAQAASQ